MARCLVVLGFLLLDQTVIRADNALPEPVRKEFNSYVGTWEGTLELSGQDSPAKWTAEWAPGKQCLVIQEEYAVDGEPSKITALMGYDRIKKHVTNLGFRTDGGHRTLVFADNMTEGTAKGDGPDGELWDSEFKIKKNGPNQWDFEFKGISPAAKDFIIRLRRKG